MSIRYRLLFLLLAVFSVAAQAQTPLPVKRASPSVLARDANVQAYQVLIVPVVPDTATANSYLIDSLGMVIQIRSTGVWMKRDTVLTGGHKWDAVSAGGGSTNTSVGSKFAVAINGTNNVKSLDSAWGTKLDSSQANIVKIGVDSGSVASKKYVQQQRDSLGGVIGTKLASISTNNSVTGNGTPASPVQLAGDAGTPGNSQYYGTNGSGAKGYYSLPSGVAAADPTSSIGVVAVNGSASTFMRSDAAPAIDTTGTNIHTDGFNRAKYKQIADSNQSVNSYASVGRLNKLKDSLSALILFKLDSNQSIHSWASIGRINKIADSLSGLFMRTLDSNQSIHSWASIGRLNKLADSLSQLINAKVTNYAGASFIGGGLFASRPAATTGAGFWYASDQQILYYSNGTTWAQATDPPGSNVKNNGASTSVKAGPYLSRPSASNCQCYYWSTDSTFMSYDNGVWKDLKSGSSGGSLPTGTPGHILVANSSGSFTDTPLVNDLGSLPEISQWIAGKGDTSTIDTVAGYRFNTVDSIPWYYSTVGVGAEHGGWLTASTSGDSIMMSGPFGVIGGNSIAAGHKSHVSRLETGGGTGGFISNYPDSTGQLSYEFRQLTNMRWYNAGIGGQTTTQIRTRFLRDFIGLTINVGDGRPNQTLPRKPSFIIIEGAINDFFNNVLFETTKNNLMWMVMMCRQYNIPCAIYNSPGDAVSASQAQLGWVRGLNDWLASGALGPNCYVIDMNAFWNDPTYGNNNVNHIADISDDVHFTPTGYHNLALFTMATAKLPVLDSIRFITALAPSSPIANYNRPASVSIGRGTAYGATYTLANSPTVTVPVTQPIMDSTWFTILASTNVTGSSTQTGFSSVLFHIGNNPTHQVWKTQTPKFAGGVTPIVLATQILIQGKDGAGDTTLDIRGPDGNYRVMQVQTNSGGGKVVINGNTSFTNVSSAALTVHAATTSSTGIGTDGGIVSNGTLNQIGNLQINTNANAGATGYGIDVNGVSLMSLQVNPTTTKEDYTLDYWSGTSKAVGAAVISKLGIHTGYGSFGSLSEHAYGILYSPTLNNTASFTGDFFNGYAYRPVVTSLGTAGHRAFISTAGDVIHLGGKYLFGGTADSVGISSTALMEIKGKLALTATPDTNTGTLPGGYVVRNATTGNLELAPAPSGGSTPPFDDNTAIAKNHSDNTKQFKFDLSAIGASTTRTWAVPNYNGTFAALDHDETFSATTVNVAHNLIMDPSTGNLNTGSAVFVLGQVWDSTNVTSNTLGTGAGTSASLGSNHGCGNIVGKIDIVTGTSPSASATVLTITVSTNYGDGGVTPIILSPANAAAAALTGNAAVWADAGNTTINLHSGSTPLAASTEYKWNYIIMKHF